MSASEKEEDQRIPLYLSSATSAEYGNLQSLSRRIASGKLNAASLPGVAADPLSAVAGRTNGGITPLHLAAQHGQLGAVTMLLRESGCGVDTGLVESGACSPVSEGGNACGATPLHRAAFSGAVGCMFALITWRRGDVAEGRGGGGSGCVRCNLLASDTSFGDEKTPLHKALGGGRPLAVRLLLDALAHDRHLDEALRIEDASGRTVLDYGRHYSSMGEEETEHERQSVRRWDAVAGGTPADWRTCCQLLELAAYDPSRLRCDCVVEMNSLRVSMDNCRSESDTSSFEKHLRESLTSSLERLQTKPSQRDGQSAAENVDTTNSSSTKDETGKTGQPSSQPFDVVESTAPAEDCSNPKSNEPASMGRNCDSCGRPGVSFFRVGDQLVCKQCRKRSRR